MKDEKNHHVAWKDRLNLNQIWIRDAFTCSEAYGTEQYIIKVDRFKNDIVNIKKGPKLRNIVDDYFNKTLKPLGDQLLMEWKQNNQQESKIEEEVGEATSRIRQYQAEKMHNYILQTLEDYGFGFYKSEVIDEDDTSEDEETEEDE